MRVYVCIGIAVFCAGVLGIPHAVSADHGGHELIVKHRSSEEVQVLRFSSDEALRYAMMDVAFRADIEYAEPNSMYHAAVTPNDPLYTQQWSLPQVGAPDGWNMQTGTSDVVVAVVDTGIDITHPDLAANLWLNTDEIAGNGVDDDANGYVDDIQGWDFVNNSNDPRPRFAAGWTSTGVNHGTVVAGIATAIGNNAEGIAGVAWGVRMMPVRVLGDDGLGSTLTVAQGVQYAAANGADIINLSFVGSSNSQTLANAINAARTAGIVVVAAAGNDNKDLDATPQYPVCTSGVVGVAATDRDDHRASFSNYGSCIDVAAPGVEMTSTVYRSPAHGLTDAYASGWYGTSLASPFISGALALAKSANPALRVEELESLVYSTAFDISALNPAYPGKLGSGRVDIAEVLGTADTSLADDIVSGLGSGQPPTVKILDADGTTLTTITAFDSTFLGGVHVASGDLNGDGEMEIVVGAGNGGGPQIRIFSRTGKLLGSFFAYDSNFRGGVHVATGDLNGNGSDEIIAGAGNGGGPHIRIFSDKGTLLGSFFAYDSNFRGGVHVATGDLDGNGMDEVIAGAGYGGGPHIRLFTPQGVLQGSFFAYDSAFRGGVEVASGDVNADGKDDIIAAAGPGGGPQIRMFTAHGTVVDQFFGFDDGIRSGIVIDGVRR